MGKYDTSLSSDEEKQFQSWKSRFAPKDSGTDYDLRGAFKAGFTPNPKTGHWPDTFKKPNHPTFSDQSIYAKDKPELAGHWIGEKFIPPTGGINMAYGNDRKLRRGAASRVPTMYRGININAAPTGNPTDINTQGQVLIGPSGGPSAAIMNRSRSDFGTPVNTGASRSNLTMVDSPQGGSLGVTAGQLQKYLDKGYKLSQPTLTPSQQKLQNFDQAAAYRKGYGEAVPSIQPSASGPVLAQGGVSNPIGNLSSQQRQQYGVGSFLDSLRSSPLSVALQNFGSPIIANAVSRVGQGISDFFGGSAPIPTAGAAVPAPSQTPIATPSPAPTPSIGSMPLASNDRQDLNNMLNQSSETQFLGQPVPTPTPSPTPVQGKDMLASNPPRRYSDYY